MVPQGSRAPMSSHPRQPIAASAHQCCHRSRYLDLLWAACARDREILHPGRRLVFHWSGGILCCPHWDVRKLHTEHSLKEPLRFVIEAGPILDHIPAFLHFRDQDSPNRFFLAPVTRRVDSTDLPSLVRLSGMQARDGPGHEELPTRGVAHPKRPLGVLIDRWTWADAILAFGVKRASRGGSDRRRGPRQRHTMKGKSWSEICLDDERSLISPLDLLGEAGHLHVQQVHHGLLGASSRGSGSCQH